MVFSFEYLIQQNVSLVREKWSWTRQKSLRDTKSMKSLLETGHLLGLARVPTYYFFMTKGGKGAFMVGKPGDPTSTT